MRLRAVGPRRVGSVVVCRGNGAWCTVVGLSLRSGFPNLREVRCLAGAAAGAARGHCIWRRMRRDAGIIRVPRWRLHYHDVASTVAVQILATEDTVAGAGAAWGSIAILPGGRRGVPDGIADIAERLAWKLRLNRSVVVPLSEGAKLLHVHVDEALHQERGGTAETEVARVPCLRRCQRGLSRGARQQLWVLAGGAIEEVDPRPQIVGDGVDPLRHRLRGSLVELLEPATPRVVGKV